jgi:peptidoglycan/LPS O-acetylase OafA/YrhL
MLSRSTSETSLTGMAENNAEEKKPALDSVGRSNQEKGFIPSLEGIRGAAILIVLISHLFPPFSHFSWNLGMMGVTIFFVMSGYLITGILLKMHVPTRRYDHLPLFFANRVVRLSPALFLAISATVLIWLGQGRSFALIRNHALSSFFYLENIFCRLPGHKDQVSHH